MWLVGVVRSESQVEVAWVGPFVSVAQCMRSLYRTRRVGECCTSFFVFKPGRPRDEVLEFALCRHDFIPRSCEFLQALVFAPAGAEFVLGFFASNAEVPLVLGVGLPLGGGWAADVCTDGELKPNFGSPVLLPVQNTAISKLSRRPAH